MAHITSPNNAGGNRTGSLALTEDRGLARKAAVAGFVGTSLEWYDYFLYGSAAALVFPTLFFNGMGTGGATLASLASFGVSFLFRPLGGFVFGHLGDRIGRKKTLI